MRLRSTAPCTTSAMATRSRLTLRPPASIRDMSSRLATKRASRAVSSSIDDRSSSRSDGLILSPKRAQRGRRAGDRRQRRAQVVRERVEQRVAHLLVFLHRRRVHRLAREQRPIERDRGQIEDRGQRALVLRGDRLVRRMRLEAADRDRPARGDQRPKLIGDARQRAGSPARRLLFLLRPARGAESGGVELRVGRPGGANLQFVPLGDQEHDAAAERRVQMRRGRPEHVVGARCAGKLARVIVERLGDLERS